MSANVEQSGMPDTSIRFKIDAAATVKLLNQHIADKQGKPLIAESEICEIPLVPLTNDDGTPLVSSNDSATTIKSKVETFWSQHKLTGDNLLERPYAHIYPRVTTKSNTYTVHVRVQRIQVSPAGLQAGEFGTGKGAVTGEFRGSFTIERFLEPNSDSLVIDEGAGNLVPVSDENDSGAILGPYKFRVLSSKQLSL